MHPRVDALPDSERIVTLDIVRGFALLGILIMNMPGFANSFFVEADGSHLWNEPWDLGAELAREMLFSGKFNSMFSLLFGIGFTIQLGRLQARDAEHAVAIYTRRLLALLAFGLLHAFVFWNGDVLHVYALLGFMLLFLRNVSNRTVCLLIALCLLYPVVSGVLRLVLITPEMVKANVALMQSWEASNNAAYGIVVMLVFGVLGFIMEENDIPIAPCILGIVLGPILERTFVTTMIKADGSLLAFFERPIAAGLGVALLLIWASLLIAALRGHRAAAAGAS